MKQWNRKIPSNLHNLVKGTHTSLTATYVIKRNYFQKRELGHKNWKVSKNTSGLNQSRN